MMGEPLQQATPSLASGAAPINNNPLPPSLVVHDYYISTENINEALFLLISASVGFICNTLVVVCIVTSQSMHKMTNAFVVHGCVLDAIKCLYCVPFATSLLRHVAPGFCAALGGSYVVIVTVGFNGMARNRLRIVVMLFYSELLL